MLLGRAKPRFGAKEAVPATCLLAVQEAAAPVAICLELFVVVLLQVSWHGQLAAQHL